MNGSLYRLYHMIDMFYCLRQMTRIGMGTWMSAAGSGTMMAASGVAADPMED
jgi:hypothetical protein